MSGMTREVSSNSDLLMPVSFRYEDRVESYCEGVRASLRAGRRGPVSVERTHACAGEIARYDELELYRLRL